MNFNPFKSKDISPLVVFSLLLMLSIAWVFWAQIELGVKIIFLGLFFILGFIYNAWNKASQKSFEFVRKVKLLNQKIFEVKAGTKKKSNYSRWGKFTTEFLDGLIGVDALLFFVENKNKFKPIYGYNLSRSAYQGISLESNLKLFSRLKSLVYSTHKTIFEIESVGEDHIPKELKELSDQAGFNLLFQIGDGPEIFAFALIKTEDKKLSEFEFNLILWAGKKIAKEFEIEKLKEELQSKKRRMKSYLSLVKWKEATSEKELKKKVFDLFSLFQETEKLYNSLDEERLFFILIDTLQKHFDTTKILVFLPEEKTPNLYPKYSKNIELENLSPDSLLKKSDLYFWVQNKAEPFFISEVEKKLKENKLLEFLRSNQLLLGSKLNLPDGRFGMVVLGKKDKNEDYQEIDLSSFSILLSMTSLSLKNIKQFKTIEELSYTDSMTSLYNYRYFYQRLNEEIFRAKRFERKLALVIFDIDQFKIYNDSFGHQAGDGLLKQLGSHLLKVVRSIDVVCRYGGEEFCVIMPETDSKECIRFMERLRKSIEDYEFKDEYLDHNHHITVSLGAAIYPQDAKNADKLIWCADMALLEAKNEGRNRSIIYEREEAAVKNTI